jgi:DNA mismatch repair protein MutS
VPEDCFHVVEGRHPVVSCKMTGEVFVPNDVDLDELRRMMLITGPNMAGKSTYIRQVALLSIMAQMGSFVPAASARMGIVDRVFTRIGASDDLAHGASTFMVEMLEVANILNCATDRSLVILDEVGRGTSTYDGLSLAWSITEYLACNVGAKTLFATHYHELCELASTLPTVVNFNVAVREWQDEILFLHKIVEGSADRSYGLHVARLAGLPSTVLTDAQVVLDRLESSQPYPPQPAGVVEFQTSLFEMAPDKIREKLKDADFDQMTPMAALAFLDELKRLL